MTAVQTKTAPEIALRGRVRLVSQDDQALMDAGSIFTPGPIVEDRLMRFR
jgi:hypothetical protein